MNITTFSHKYEKVNSIYEIATQRITNMFLPDLGMYRAQVEAEIRGARVLVIGGAGSVGSATIFQIAQFQPAAIHVVDINENGLVELVRDLRGSNLKLDSIDFRALPLDFGSLIMLRYITTEKPYDHVLNFAAVKHVRSEKSVYSILHMLDTNVLKVARLMEWLKEKGGTKSFFAVSTDKAANPANLMGASKLLMEHILFSKSSDLELIKRLTSARFANVAFSDGSLLHGWTYRLGKRQALAVPKKTWRFFISLEESGTICLLAAFCGPNRRILIPQFDMENGLQELQKIAERFLRHYGYEPAYYEDEDDAKDGLENDLEKRMYPLLLTPLNTSGEKNCEEFVGKGEIVNRIGMKNLLSINYKPLDVDKLKRLLKQMQDWISNSKDSVSKQNIIDAISEVLSEMVYTSSKKSLDERM